MPVFNREKLVTRAIRSCLAQTGDDFEIVVTDDGSTDGTVDVIEQIGEPRIKLVRHATNLGHSAARNSCVDAAVGEWIVILDSDDELLPGGLDKIRKAVFDSGDEVDCLQFMYDRDDGGCSPDPPFVDGSLTFEDYLRMLDRWTRFDPLFCMRREASLRLPWKPWSLSGAIWQRFEIHSQCRCTVSSQVVALIHTDATNRISWYRRGPKVAQRAGVDLGEFKLDNIPFMRRGVPKIEVVFDVDADGIVTVKAIDETTKNEKVMVLSGSLSKEEMTKMLIDAEENKIDDERFIQLSNLREWLTSLKIQLFELVDTKVLSEEEVKELDDLRESIEADYNSENIELVSSLVESGRELVNFLTKKVYDQAKKEM